MPARVKMRLRNALRHHAGAWSAYAALSRLRRAALSFLPDAMYIRLLYRENMGRRLNLHDPATFTEKLQWMKLHDRNPLYTTLADKYAVREFVKMKAGEQYLARLLGVYGSFDEIPFGSLPERFVLKCAHDSGSGVICRDKAALDMGAARRKMSRALRANYYYASREWPYRGAVPRIIAEEYLEDGAPGGLRDYKIFCFGGKAEYVQVHLNRETCHTANAYDRDWNFVDEQFSNFPHDENVAVPRPERLDEMLWLAETLSEGLPFVRVDLYHLPERIVFGEMTFYPAGGMGRFASETFARHMGDLIDLGLCQTLGKP